MSEYIEYTPVYVLSTLLEFELSVYKTLYAYTYMRQLLVSFLSFFDNVVDNYAPLLKEIFLLYVLTSHSAIVRSLFIHFNDFQIYTYHHATSQNKFLKLKE